jgi:homoserine kinase
MRAVSDLVGTEILVPASISNLGPGFDTLSVAVQIYLRAQVVGVSPAGAGELSCEFVGRALVGENRIERAFRAAADRSGLALPSLAVAVRSEIPLRAGLGSSGAAAVAGLRLFEALAGPRPNGDWLTIAARLEGHPDNAAASLLGGLTSSCQREDGTAAAYRWRWPPALRFVIATPEVEVETPMARRILPDAFPRADAIFNVQRVALLLHTLQSGRYEELREALRDRWHQPYRERIVPGLASALALEHPDLYGVCLSGSGPSVVGIAERNFEAIEGLFAEVYRRLGIPCRVRTVSAHQPDTSGSCP